MADSPQSPVRPSNNRHSSSWISRFHRKHDAKYHPTPPDQDDDANENFDVEQPLLRDEEPRDVDETAPTVQDKVRNGCTYLGQWLWRHLLWILLALAFVLLIALIILSIVFYIQNHSRRDYCNSPACLDAASHLLNNMDSNYRDIDACTHLDRLVCNGFRHQQYIKADRDTASTFSLLQEHNGFVVRRILEEDIDNIKSEDRDNFKKINDSYNACMNESEIWSTSIAPLQAVAQQIETLYPVSAPRFGHLRRPSSAHMITVMDTQHLTDVFLYMLKRDIVALLQLEIKANDKHPEEQVIYASPPCNSGLPKRFYEEDNLHLENAATRLGEYRQTLARVMPYFSRTQHPGNSSFVFGPPRLSVTDDQYLDGIIEFERQLAGIIPSEEDLNDPENTYNSMTLEEIQMACPDISFAKVIRGMAPKDYQPDVIVVTSPMYLTRMCQLVNQTADEFLQGFFVWNAIRRFAYAIENDTAIEPYKRFINKLDGKMPYTRPDRSAFCVDIVNSGLGLILWKFFVDAALPHEFKTFGENIVYDIRDSFDEIVKESSWMSEDVKERAVRKVRGIAQKIGYSITNPDIMDAHELEEYYGLLKIAGNTFFQNEIKSTEFKTQRGWSKLGKPTDRREWSIASVEANAYYNPTADEIAFPAGIMQIPVFYPSDVPHYLTFGSFGCIAGRELSLAFDNRGFKYDEGGRLSNWWDNETQSLFEEKLQCFVNQYSQHSITGPDGEGNYVNGRLTLDENEADASGVHAAYSAWKKHENSHNSKWLPGLEYFTKDQLFFISSANMHCSLTRNEVEVQRIYSDSRAPNLARVLGTMHNSRAFREAFNCPTTEPTCSLW